MPESGRQTSTSRGAGAEPALLEGGPAGGPPAGTAPRLSSPSIEFHEIDLASLGIDLAMLGLDEAELCPAPRPSSPSIEFHEIDVASLELDDLDALDPLERLLVRPEWVSSPAEAEAPGQSRISSASERPMLEVEVGLVSKSNFYAGLDMDVSAGGLFVATYELLPAGTNVLVSFGLPGGREVVTPGQVRWFKEPCGDAPPGMGVAFAALAPEDRAAIERFCRRREPLYYEAD